MAFSEEFTQAILHGCFEYHPNNVDHAYFEADNETRERDAIRDEKFAELNRSGLAGCHFDPFAASAELNAVYRALNQFEALHSSLANTASRRQLIEILKFRALGPYHAKLSINNSDYWQVREDIRHLRVAGRVKSDGSTTLAPYAMKFDDGIVHLYTEEFSLLNVFILEQFRYRYGRIDVGAKSGDTVIDVGTAYGESTLYFANTVGPRGAVHALDAGTNPVRFENLQNNAQLSAIISSQQGQILSPKGEVMSGDVANPWPALDVYVESQQLSEVDLLKLNVPTDVLIPLLNSSMGTLNRFQPNLALAISDPTADLLAAANFFRQLDVDYRLFLDHYTIHEEATTLFASPVTNSARTTHQLAGFVAC